MKHVKTTALILILIPVFLCFGKTAFARPTDKTQKVISYQILEKFVMGKTDNFSSERRKQIVVQSAKLLKTDRTASNRIASLAIEQLCEPSLTYQSGDEMSYHQGIFVSDADSSSNNNDLNALFSLSDRNFAEKLNIINSIIVLDLFFSPNDGIANFSQMF